MVIHELFKTSLLEKKNPLFGFHVLSLASLEKGLHSELYIYRHFYNQLFFFFFQMTRESLALDNMLRVLKKI